MTNAKKSLPEKFLHNHGFYKYLYVYPKNGKHPTMNAFYAKVHRINCETTNNLNISDDVNVVKKRCND